MSYGIGGRFTQVRIAVGDSGNTIQQIDRLGSRHCYRRGEWCSLKIFLTLALTNSLHMDHWFRPGKQAGQRVFQSEQQWW